MRRLGVYVRLGERIDLAVNELDPAPRTAPARRSAPRRDGRAAVVHDAVRGVRRAAAPSGRRSTPGWPVTSRRRVRGRRGRRRQLRARPGALRRRGLRRRLRGDRARAPRADRPAQRARLQGVLRRRLARLPVPGRARRAPAHAAPPDAARARAGPRRGDDRPADRHLPGRRAGRLAVARLCAARGLRPLARAAVPDRARRHRALRARGRRGAARPAGAAAAAGRSPSAPCLRVDETGLLDLVVDGGRDMGGRFGMAQSGPADARAARLANALVGNDAQRAAARADRARPVADRAAAGADRDRRAGRACPGSAASPPRP